ncbi:MAG: OsmC family protein [Actinomycetota bacterium]
MELREVQEPLKQRYREDVGAAVITIRAASSSGDGPMACSVDIGRAVYEAQAHAGVGGAGTAACSGDLLLGALAACAQVTCQMVAAAMQIPVTDVRVAVEGELDLRGTLGLSRDVPVGFERIQVKFDLAGPEVTAEQLDSLREKTERYCVVLQTLTGGTKVDSVWPAARLSRESAAD